MLSWALLNSFAVCSGCPRLETISQVGQLLSSDILYFEVKRILGPFSVSAAIFLSFQKFCGTHHPTFTAKKHTLLTKDATRGSWPYY